MSWHRYQKDGGTAWDMWLNVSAQRKDAHLEKPMREREDTVATTAQYFFNSKTIEAACRSISACTEMQTGKNTKKITIITALYL